MNGAIVLSGRKIPLTVIRKPNKYLYLRILPEGTLQIRANRMVPVSAIEAFIQKNEVKILTELDRLDRKTPLSEDEAWFLGTIIPCQRAAFPSPVVRYADGTVRMGVFSDSTQERRALERFYGTIVLEEIRRVLNERREEWSRDLDLEKITFKTQRMSSQFGSCQSQRRIVKLNTLLGRFDRKYLEAILIHELCHLKVHNHGSDFYDLLLTYSPDYRHLRRELNHLVKTIGV